MSRLLSAKERQICQLIYEGKTLHQAADLLGMTYHGIKARTTIIRAKLGCSSTLMAADLYCQSITGESPDSKLPEIEGIVEPR